MHNRDRQRHRVPSLLELLSPEVVAGWIRCDLADEARAMIRAGRLTRPSIRRTVIGAIVADPERGRVRASIAWDGEGPVSRCECDDWRDPCCHSAALGLLMVGDAGEEADGDGLDDADHADDPSPPALPESPAETERRRRRERGQTDLFTVRPLGRAVAPARAPMVV